MAARLLLATMPPVLPAPPSDVRRRRRRTTLLRAFHNKEDEAALSRARGVTSNLELSGPKKQHGSGNAVYTLLLANLGVFAMDRWLQLEAVKLLYLYHARPLWYQFVTATFCHYNWGHLSSNLFFLYIFGKLVEEEEGSFALWASYLITGAGANLVSFLVLPPNVVSIGASGAVFGLFAISVLVKLSWDWKRILEVLILGQFVVDKVLEAARASAVVAGGYYASSASSSINHIAHCAGALVGVLLIWLLSKLPPRSEKTQ